MKKIYFSIFLMLFSNTSMYSETKITYGIAEIGNAITLEKAKEVALLDAQQKALNEFGVFLKSKTKVENRIITEDKIESITAALIKSEIIEIKKELINDIFFLKVKVKSEIDEESLDNAIKNYMDQSKKDEMIGKLLEENQLLRKQLITLNKTDSKIIKTIDEFNFNNQRIKKLLTTRKKIDNELEVYQHYKKLIKQTIKSMFDNITNEIKSKLKWDTLPRVGYNNILYLPCTQHCYHGRNLTWGKNCCLRLDTILRDYKSLGMKINPYIHFETEFKLPIYLYVNESVIEAGDIKIMIRKYSERLFTSISLIDELKRSKLFIGVGYFTIYLPKEYTLQNIEDIDVRIGEPNLSDIEIIFRTSRGVRCSPIFGLVFKVEIL